MQIYNQIQAPCMCLAPARDQRECCSCRLEVASLTLCDVIQRLTILIMLLKRLVHLTNKTKQQ